MEKLDKAYEAIEMLKALGATVSARRSDSTGYKRDGATGRTNA